MRFIRAKFLEISFLLAAYVVIASIALMLLVAVDGPTILIILLLGPVFASALFYVLLAFSYREDVRFLMTAAQFPEENPAVVIRIDSSGKFIYLNKAARTFLSEFGFTEETVPDFIAEHVKQCFEERKKIKTNISLEDRVFDFDFVPSEDLSYANVFCVDITEQRLLRNQLVNHEQMLQKILDETPIMLYSVNETGIITMLEGQGLMPLNMNADDIIGHSVHEVLPELGNITRALELALEGETVNSVDEIGKRIFESNISPVRREDGTSSGVIGVSMDVTDHYDAHEQLRKNLEMYHQLFEQTNDGVILTGLNQRIIRANKRAGEMLGFSTTELIGMDSASFIFLGGGSRTLRTNQVFEHHFERPDGTTLWAEVGITIIRNSAGIPTFVQCVLRDVSDRKEAEERLRESEEILRLFVEHTPAAIAMLDTEMQYVITSERWRQDYQLGNQPIIGRSHYDLFPNTPEHWREIHQRCVQGAVERSDADLFPRPDGQLIWIRWEVRPWYRRNTIGGVLMFTEVITDIKEAQLALQATTTRLETLLANMQSGILVEDENRNIAIANQAFCDFFNLEIAAESLVGQDFEAILETSKSQFTDPESFIKEINELHENQEISIGIEVETLDGRTFERDYIPILAEENYLGHLWQYRDVTERKHNEAERERLISILNNSQDFIGLADLQGKLVFVNPAGLALSGYTHDQIEQLSVADLVEETQLQNQVELQLRNAIEEGIWRGENQFRHADGTTFPVEQALFVIRDEDGKPQTIATIATDITERKKAEQELMLQERAIASSTSGIIITDAREPDMPLIYANPAFLKTTGYRLEEVIGKNCRFLQNDDRDQPVLNDVRAALQEGRDITVVLRNYRKNGELFYNELNIAPVRDGNGSITHYVGIVNDISDRIRTEKNLALARDQALEASRLKSEFLATMSHEIRTPMNGIIGMNELLLITELSAEQREFATTAYKEAHHLLRIINDILDFSKIEADKVVLEKLEFSPSELMDSVITLLKPSVEEKKLELDIVMGEAVPSIAVGDVQRLRQIIVNLLSNAIKFTHEGGITIHVDAQHLPEHGDLVQLHISIQDTGIGLSDSARKRLFQPFTQADGSTTRKYGGTGLGLAISQSLVRLMDGEINVESKEGEGSNFYFNVILETPTKDRTETEDGLIRVLIVDDSAAYRRIIERYCRSWGVDYQSIGSAESAIALLRESENTNPYDVIIVDRILPEMDGLEFARLIHEKMHTSLPHLIMLTAFDEPSLSEMAAELGFEGYLIKPVSPSTLLETIHRVTGKTGDMSHFVSDLDGNMAQSSDDEGVPPTILLVEDNAMNRDVTSRQLEKLGYYVKSFTNGHEAIEYVQQPTEKFDLILMDCQMPGINGLEATQEIRKWEQENGQHTPIIAITANTMQTDIDQCFAAGMDDYISKPVTIKRLQRLVEDWLYQENR